MTLPLDHLRILDLSQYPPGHYASMLLADMGADVIHISAPASAGRRAASGQGDVPLYARLEDQKSLAYNALMRNKRNACLNLKHEGARDAFYRLVKRSDVVLEGFRPGVAQRLDVHYDKLREVNPRIIYCALTGYGQDGPYRLRAGHDVNYLSIAGALSAIGTRDGRPVIPLNLIGDFAAGSLNCVIGVLLAVVAREKTGRGQSVDISMTDGAFGLLTFFLHQHFQEGHVFRPSRERLNGGAPYYQVYRCKDGRYVSVGAIEPYFFESLCKLVGREDLVAHQNDASKHAEMERALEQAFLTRTSDEWASLLGDKDTCVALPGEHGVGRRATLAPPNEPDPPG